MDWRPIHLHFQIFFIENFFFFLNIHTYIQATKAVGTVQQQGARYKDVAFDITLCIELFACFTNKKNH